MILEWIRRQDSSFDKELNNQEKSKRHKAFYCWRATSMPLANLFNRIFFIHYHWRNQ